MAEVKNYWQGDLAGTLDRELGWMLSRLNANVSPFTGNAVTTPTSPALGEGAVDMVSGTYTDLAQTAQPNIVLDPLTLPDDLDQQQGPDGFPINYSPINLGPSGGTIVNVLDLSTTKDVSGRVFNLVEPADKYRVDIFSRTDLFYYQGSAPIATEGTWKLVDAHPGVVIAVLYPITVAQPAPDSSFATLPADWVAHSNLGIGKKLRDYFVRLYVKTDIEYLQEDNIPIIVQDFIHARFGTSRVVASGTPVVHVVYDDPALGPVDLYSSLQNLAIYSDLPRGIEVPPGDPDFAGPGLVVSSNIAYIQNRCWVYDAALAVIVFSMAGLWENARRIITRLNALREDPGYLPSQILEDAEDGSVARWALIAGEGSMENVFDPSEPPAQSGGSKVISLTATSAPATWNFTGPGLPDGLDSLVQWRYLTDVAHKFVVGVTSSTGKVTTLEFVTAGDAGYNAVTKTITTVISWMSGNWRVVLGDLGSLIARYVPDEALISVDSFKVALESPGNLRFDNLSAGGPQPAGSLSFSYDVYNGQVDQAYIRSGAIAWVCYAYGIYMERTGDFQSAAFGLQAMLNFLFSLQSTAADLRQNLIMLGWGRYEDPGYRYLPGQLTSVSTEHNLDCYFAFAKAARVLPTAAQNLVNRGWIDQVQYNSLLSSATTAASKAAQVRTAILSQLWIPASGQTQGHFAQGASNAGLDTSLALDASGSWAALFCHEVGDDAKAVECLEFIFENFLLTNQQILKSAQPDSYNQAFEQLTTFDGFKPYADSQGGYSNSPNSVWMEGTWGALAAYLALSDNANLGAYFNANYSGGFDAFLARLVRSMKIVSSTTGDHGLLSFSLTARRLPWEFSVRKTLAATAWFWMTSMRNALPLTTTTTPILGPPYLKVPQGVQQSVRQLEGQSSLGALELEVIDGSGYMTALASGGKLEGRKAALKVGYPGMAMADFVTVATQEIESVRVLPDSTGYVLQCRDLKRSAKSKIFTQGDDGYATSQEHPRTLLANPMDVVLMVLQNELGLGQVPWALESTWKIYDPRRWDLTNSANPTLIFPNPYVDVEKFLFYRNGIFAGYQFDFKFDQPVEAKQFLEFEIFRALGGYLIVLADGRLSPNFFLPPYAFLDLFAFNERNMTVLPELERHPIINQVTYRMDYDGSKFQTELLFLSSPSLEQYGLAGQHIIESKGLKAARGGTSLAELTATRIFRRYGGIDPVSGAPNGGAPILAITSHFMTLTVEVSDTVFVSHPLLSNFETGRRGVFNRIYEVIEKQPNYSEGTMTYRLLDAGWMVAKKLSRIAPLGTPAYTAASSSERTRYMFLAQKATRTYTDGTSGKTIF